MRIFPSFSSVYKFLVASSVSSAQGSFSAQGSSLYLSNLPNLESVELPDLKSADGRIIIKDVPKVSHIRFDSLKYVGGCSVPFPLKPVLAANDKGVELEKRADQYKDKGDIVEAKRHYKAAHKAYLKATEKEKKLKCTEIDVFAKNAERVKGKLNGLPNQKLGKLNGLLPNQEL